MLEPVYAYRPAVRLSQLGSVLHKRFFCIMCIHMCAFICMLACTCVCMGQTKTLNFLLNSATD